MKPFTITELKHLKYKLINEQGKTPDEANQHIQNLIEYEKGIQKLIKGNTGKESSARKGEAGSVAQGLFPDSLPSQTSMKRFKKIKGGKL